MRKVRWWHLPVFAVAVGVLAGLAGVAITVVLHLVQHLAFGYTENTFLIGVQRASYLRRVGALTLGGLVVALGWWWHRRHVDREDVSVTRAVREPDRPMPVRATFIDALLQEVAVGVGASLGREGAPRQAAAALAGWLAARFHLSNAHRRLLIASGAGAGLAVVYNVPLAGAAFTLEVLLVSRAWRDLITALISATVATAVGWPVLSMHPTYTVAAVQVSWPVAVCALIIGPLAGVLGVAFTRFMTRARTHAPTGPLALVTVVLGFAALGMMAIAYPQLLGNGKGSAELAFNGAMGLGLAATLTLLKPVATGGCLGAGAIGGLLTPALATGATFGLAAGQVWSQVWPGGMAGAYALIGAAAVLAVTQRAPVTAVLIVLELTHTGLQLLAPMIVAVLLAVFVARRLSAVGVKATPALATQ